MTTGSSYPSGGDDRSRRTQRAQTNDSPAGRQVLIGTKLHIPSDTGRTIARDAALSRLDAGVAGGKITVVSAPAGWGKTTLLAQWASRQPTAHCVTWLSLEPADNDATRFWSYVIGTFESTRAEFGRSCARAARGGR